MRKQRLFTPGPTPLMPEAQLALARPIIHHRTPQFIDLFLETRNNLQKILQTKNDVVILASSGTGAMEAAVSNLLSTDEQALAVVAGKFGERWLEICKAHKIPCTALHKPAGEACSPEEICQALENHPETRVLLIQACETSTATSHDLELIAQSVHQKFPAVLIVVDAISALLTQPLQVDDWGLDIVISGSQKSLGLPPGLAFMSISPSALERIKNNKVSSYYFDLSIEIDKQRKGQTAYTPAISLIDALKETTQEILRQDPRKVLAEVELMAHCTREALLALNFRLLSSSPSSAVTAAFPPEGVSAKELIKKLDSEFGVMIAGGQSELKGKIIRIAHLGYLDLIDVFAVISSIELCLLRMETKIEVGLGLRTALLEAAKPTNISE